MRESRPRLTPIMKFVNASIAALRAVGLELERLDVASVHEAAMRRTGLTDFGEPYYVEGLEHLIDSLRGEVQVHASGRFFVREMIVKYLANRLLLCEVRKRAPELFERPLVPPLIVVGLPRSGTSALHRALAADPAHRAMPYWELVNPFTRTGVLPPVSEAKLLRQIDRRFAVRARVTPEVDRQHYLRADSPEECTFLLGLTFTSLVFWMLAPVYDYLCWYLRQDRTQVYREYRDLLHVAQAASERRLVLKAPEHASALGALLAAVPEAMIVQTHRHPAEVCLSLDSMLLSNHGALSEGVDPPRLAAANAALVERIIERNLADRLACSSAVHDVRYESLVADPLAVVRGVYERFGLPWSSGLEAELSAHLAGNPQGKHGWHRYRAADFGESEVELRRRFDGYFERYGLADDGSPDEAVGAAPERRPRATRAASPASVLLINSNRCHIPVPVIPVGLCSVGAALRRTGARVELLDLGFADDPAARIAAAVKRFAPDVVGVGVRNIDNGDGLANHFFLDEINREILAPLVREFTGPVVLGGGAVGISAREILELTGLDLALRGEGELAMVELVRRLRASAPLEGLPGLVRRVEGAIVEEGPPARVDDLDDLPFVDPSEFIDLEPYRRAGSPLQVQTKRGCRLSCTYCTYNTIEGRRCRLRSPERIADDVARLAARTGISRFEIVDSTFNLPSDHAKAVLRAIIARGLRVELSVSNLNPGAVDEELVDLIRRANFVELGLGAEALSDPALQGLGKNYSAADVARAIELLESTGIPLVVYLILGGPGETRETLAETFAALASRLSRWSLICAAVGVRPYRGAPIARELERARPGCSPDNFLRHVPLEPAGLSLDEVWWAAKRAGLQLPNLLLYGEQTTEIPVPVQRALSRAFEALSPRQPVWRLLVAANVLARATGMGHLELARLERARRLASALGPATVARA